MINPKDLKPGIWYHFVRFGDVLVESHFSGCLYFKEVKTKLPLINGQTYQKYGIIINDIGRIFTATGNLYDNLVKIYPSKIYNSPLWKTLEGNNEDI